MEPEFEQQLNSLSKEQLIELLRELASRHPVLLSEMAHILEKPLIPSGSEGSGASLLEESDSNEEATEDWDFSGDDEGAIGSIGNSHEQGLGGSVSAWSLLPTLDIEGCRQRIKEYTTRLSQGTPASTILSDLGELLAQAETRAEYSDFQGALSLYALILDERLREGSPALMPILDKAINKALPAMETVLSEASSNAMFDEATVTLSPLLSANVRHEWLKRLLALWLKHLDERNMQEDLPRIILNVAWSEDFLLLRNLVQDELQKYPSSEHSNIVDFAQQYRAHALEKFIKELASG